MTALILYIIPYYCNYGIMFTLLTIIIIPLDENIDFMHVGNV